MLGQLEATDAPLPPILCRQAMHLLPYGLALDDAWPTVSRLFVLLAPKLEQAGYRTEWCNYLERGIALSQHHNDPLVEAELSLQLGYLLQLRGHLAEACKVYARSIEQFTSAQQRQKLAKVLNRYAFVLWLLNRFEEVPQLLAQVQMLLPDTDPELSATYSVWGWLAFSHRQWDESLAQFEKALAVAEQNGSPRQTARCLRDCANVLQMKGHYEQAIIYYEQAIHRLDTLQDSFEKAVAQMNLGTVYLQAEQPAKALTHYQQALIIFTTLNDPIHLAHLYTNVGIMHRHLGQYQESKQSLVMSSRLWERLENVDLLINATAELGLTYLAEKNPRQAYQVFCSAQEYLPALQGHPTYEYRKAKIDAYVKEVTAT
ncbi:MAG: tetratricopeptide repeat protein [Caldilineaceae bacterium]|nr:tetratricopeptide repeat protein [Caldilineaceae bacterium]